MQYPPNTITILTKEEIDILVKQCADYIDTNFGNDDLLMVCILKGASYFFTDLTREMKTLHNTYYVEASSYKDSQTQAETLEILSVIVPEKFNNKTVILVDELFDNGATMHQIKEAIVKTTNVPISKVFTVTAFMKRKETIYPKPDFCPSLIPNVWVFGYGCDLKQKYRNSRELRAIVKDPNVELSEDDRLFTVEALYQQWRQTKNIWPTSE